MIYLFIVRLWVFFLQTPVLDVNSPEEGMAERTIVHKNGEQLKMCKTFCSFCLLIIHLFTFKEYNKCMKIVIISRTSCLFQDVYFLMLTH